MNRPPIWMGGGFWRKTLIPVRPKSFGRRLSMTSSALSFRSLRGLRRMNIRPELLAPMPPTAETKDSTFGSSWMILATAVLVIGHGVEGDALGRLGDADDQAGVLAREEALGDPDEQDDGQDEDERPRRPGSAAGASGPRPGSTP